MQSDLNFRLMALEFRLRDFLQPPARQLQQIGILPGMTVVDFGCGPGSYSVAAAQLAGSSGKVFAVDIHPLALRSIEKARIRNNLQHLHAIHGGRLEALQAHSIDFILLYDVLHHVEETPALLRTFHRLLKVNGIISVKDHKLNATEIEERVIHGGLFRPVEHSGVFFQFIRLDAPS